MHSSPRALVSSGGLDHKQSLATARFTPFATSAREGDASVRSRATAEQSACSDPRWLPLPGEVVADVGVAVGGIKPQAPVKWKRVIKLVDLRAGVIDGRWNVDTRRWLGQR